MKAEELIAELKEADATLNSDNYKSWSQVRLAIASAINYITPEEPEAVHGNEAEKGAFWCMEFEDKKISARCVVQCPFCERGL